MTYKIETDSFLFNNDNTEIAYKIYTPMDLPKGIIQIFHDSQESMQDYPVLADHLCSRGFIVCGIDMQGFGESINQIPGYIGSGRALSAPCNAEKMLYDIMRTKYRYLPYMLYTMGTGAVIAKKFVYEYPDITDGIVFGGIALSPDPMTKFLAKFFSLFKGKNGKSGYIENRLLSNNPKNDSDCTLTVSSIVQFIDAFSEFERNRWNEVYPANLYTLIIAGKNDPMGKGGKSSADLQNELDEFASVCDMECKIYDNSDHNLLQGADKENVIDDVTAFFERVVDGINSARTTDIGIIRQ